MSQILADPDCPVGRERGNHPLTEPGCTCSPTPPSPQGVSGDLLKILEWPDLDSTPVRAKLADTAAELAAELPRVPGEALAVLALMLIGVCDRVEIDPIDLVERVRTHYTGA